MRFILTLLAATLAAMPAMALVTPPVPQGYCLIDNSQPNDHAALAYMHLTIQQPAELKALFAECGDLQRVRNGRIQYLTQYGALFEQKNDMPAGITRADAIALLADALGMSGVTSSKAVQGDAVEGKNMQASTHAIFTQRPTALIFGGEQRHLGYHTQYDVAAVTAISMVGSKLVTFNLYAPINMPNNYQALTTLADSYIASLLAANPEPAAPAAATPAATVPAP